VLKEGETRCKVPGLWFKVVKLKAVSRDELEVRGQAKLNRVSGKSRNCPVHGGKIAYFQGLGRQPH